MIIRDVQNQDFETILQLNEDSVPHVTSIPMSKFKDFANTAAFFKVVEEQNKVIGFVIAINQGSEYESLNYKFFNAHYAEFTYIDRIVIDKKHRGKGVGSKLYSFILERMNSNILCCEVNIKPSNPKSLSFHEKAGFAEMSKLVTEQGKKVVSLLVKRKDARDKL